jgi:hypothetical protein
VAISDSLWTEDEMREKPPLRECLRRKNIKTTYEVDNNFYVEDTFNRFLVLNTFSMDEIKYAYNILNRYNK